MFWPVILSPKPEFGSTSYIAVLMPGTKLDETLDLLDGEQAVTFYWQIGDVSGGFRLKQAPRGQDYFYRNFWADHGVACADKFTCPVIPVTRIQLSKELPDSPLV